MLNPVREFIPNFIHLKCIKFSNSRQCFILSVVKDTREKIPASKHWKIIYYKQQIIIAGNSFLSVLNTVRKVIFNSINTISEVC